MPFTFRVCTGHSALFVALKQRALLCVPLSLLNRVLSNGLAVRVLAYHEIVLGHVVKNGLMIASTFVQVNFVRSTHLFCWNDSQ
jgi:hypothetical protein